MVPVDAWVIGACERARGVCGGGECFWVLGLVVRVGARWGVIGTNTTF